MLPLYFIDHEKGVSPGLLDKHGLGPVIDSARSRQILRDGPGGQPGLLVGQDGPGDFRHVATEQTWVPRFGYPGTYVGIWNDHRPTAAELKRNEMVAGLKVQMLDGDKWIVPLLREWREQDESVVYRVALPCVLQRCQQTGAFVEGDVILTFRDLWHRSCAIADDLLAQGKEGHVTLESIEFDRFVSGLLAVNYRVTGDEIGLLGLLNNELYREVLFAALDWHRLMALLGNLQRRLGTAGTEESSSDSSFGNGETQPIEADSTAIAQP